MKKLTIRQQSNRILKWYNLATKNQVIQGMIWYNEAHSLAFKLAIEYDVSVLQASQVISILSPQKKWEVNKREAIAIFNGYFNGIAPKFKYFASKRTLKECFSIMSGDFLISIARIKTYSFADNIAYPDSDEITIDRHALRVAYDDRSTRIGEVSAVQYREARQAYRQVANSLGIKGYQLQAITWVAYKQQVGR